jgi:hypothetical protein
MSEPKFGDLTGNPYRGDLPRVIRGAMDTLEAVCQGENIIPIAFVCLVNEETLCLHPMAVRSDAEGKIFTDRILPAVIEAMQAVQESREKKLQ